MENSFQGFSLLYHQFYAITDSQIDGANVNNIIKALGNKEIISQEYFLELIKVLIQRNDITKENISETYSNLLDRNRIGILDFENYKTNIGCTIKSYGIDYLLDVYDLDTELE